MSQDPLTEKLTKANGDVKKLCEFFAARKDWTLPIGAEQLVGDLVAAATKFDEHLRVLIHACGAEPTSPYKELVSTIPLVRANPVSIEACEAALRKIAESYRVDCKFD